MRILSHHFLTSFLKLFTLIFFSSMIAITVIEAMLNFESVLEYRNGRMGFATYLLFRIPSYYFRDLIPIACFAAAFYCIGLSALSREITAIKSGGISPQRTVIPLLCAAAVLSGFTLLLNESVVLQASRAWSKEKHPGGEIRFRQGSFWYHRGNAIYSVQEADREARVLHGVSVYELSPRGRLLQIVSAKRVEVEDDRHWRFLDTISRTFDPRHPAEPPRIEHLSEWSRDVTAESDLVMLEASARTLSLPKLEAYIDTQTRAGRNTTRYLALYHTRLSGPFTVFLFALLAVPLGVCSRAVAEPHSAGSLRGHHSGNLLHRAHRSRDTRWQGFYVGSCQLLGDPRGFHVLRGVAIPPSSTLTIQGLSIAAPLLTKNWKNSESGERIRVVPSPIVFR